jgi:hypothetical protein
MRVYWTLDDIAAETGISRDVLYYRFRKMELPTRRGRKKTHRLTKKEMLKLTTVGDVSLHPGEKCETRDSHPASSIINFLLSPGINKAFFGRELYPEQDSQYRMVMMTQFYHKLSGRGDRKFSGGELKRLETIIDLWVGDMIKKYEAIKNEVPADLH